MDLETINLTSVWFGVGCNIGWVTSVWTMPILIFSPVQIIMRHPLFSIKGKKLNKHVVNIISFLEKEKVLNAILGLKISNYLIFAGKRFMNFRKDLHNTLFFTRLIYQLPLIRVVSTNDSNLQKWQNCRRLLNFQLGLPNLN